MKKSNVHSVLLLPNSLFVSSCTFSFFLDFLKKLQISPEISEIESAPPHTIYRIHESSIHTNSTVYVLKITTNFLTHARFCRAHLSKKKDFRCQEQKHTQLLQTFSKTTTFKKKCQVLRNSTRPFRRERSSSGVTSNFVVPE